MKWLIKESKDRVVILHKKLEKWLTQCEHEFKLKTWANKFKHNEVIKKWNLISDWT